MLEFPDYNSIELHGKGVSRKAQHIRLKRANMFQKQDGKCHWCRMEMSMVHLIKTPSGRVKYNNSFASFDELLPRSMGGRRPPSNTVLAHASCNRNRHRRKWAHDPIYGNKK